MMRKTLEIQNLKCGGCEATILKKLTKINGVRSVAVAIENSAVTVEYDTQNTLKNAQNALTELGYPIVGEQNRLGRKVKSYLSCAVGRIGK